MGRLEGKPLIDLEALSTLLHRQFSADAAQHALMRVVEKGWHLNDEGHKVTHFAMKCAHNFMRDGGRNASGQGKYETLAGKDDNPQFTPRVPASQLERVIARQEVERLTRSECVLMGLGYTLKEIAELRSIPIGTVKSRQWRSKHA